MAADDSETFWKPEYRELFSQLLEERGLDRKRLSELIQKHKQVMIGQDTLWSWSRLDAGFRPPTKEKAAHAAEALGFATVDALLAELEARRFTGSLHRRSTPGFDRVRVQHKLADLEEALSDPQPWPGPSKRAGEPLSEASLWVSAGTASVVVSLLLKLFAQADAGETMPLRRVVLLYLGPDLSARLETAQVLVPHFRETLASNLGILRQLAAEHRLKLEERTTEIIPPWHGILYRDTLYRGTWQVSRAGHLDVHTEVEVVPLSRAPRAHAEFLALFSPKFRRPERELDLRPGEYAIFGSGPLEVRGLREAKDVDVIVSTAAWERLRAVYHPVKHAEDWKIKIGEDLEVLRQWDPPLWPVAELIRDAEMILGIPFVRLEPVREWKKKRRAPKDLPDLERIASYEKRVRRGPAVATERRAWGRALSEIMEESGLTSKQLAKQLLVTEGYVRKLEAGGDISATYLDLIAQALKNPKIPNGSSLKETLAKRALSGIGTAFRHSNKLDKVLRLLIQPEHAGKPLHVLAGEGDSTLALLSEAYSNHVGGHSPAIGSVVIHGISKEDARRFEKEGKLRPGFADTLAARVRSLHQRLARQPVTIHFKPYAAFPEWHGYVIGEHAFVGHWKQNEMGYWHAHGEVAYISRPQKPDHPAWSVVEMHNASRGVALERSAPQAPKRKRPPQKR